ncbi:MAG TPA: excinuclease ABC subunit UvrC [Acholeplasmataceae bacterium]|nr:excinuclease ABC subunit UvrC [Acholeplasmataceae bacterium]
MAGISIRDKLKLVPKKPGCYLMYNAKGEVIYVGKAKILANRLKSYFTGSHDAKTTRMVMDIDTFEYIITSSELEAFILELNLIKEHRPRYNIMLMDDKSYPYIYITDEEHPRILTTRSHKNPKGKLFGPYPNAKAAKETVELLNKVFPLRKCRHLPKKECLYYSMGQCIAPCIHKIETTDYEPYIQSITRILNGNDSELVELLEEKMVSAAENLEFERAIEYREMVQNLKETIAKQKIVMRDQVTRDIVGFAYKDDIISIQIFHMRAGKIVKSSSDVFDIHGDPEETFTDLIVQFYKLGNHLLPKEILIPYVENKDVLSKVLDTKVIVPIKGDKKKLVDLVCENAQNNLEQLKKERMIKALRTVKPLEELAKILDIEYPGHIEIFDNSNLQGQHAVSAMVVYRDGKPYKKDYRKFRIKTVEGADDYHTMQEVIKRRYSRVIRENLPQPDLIIVDGGTPQVISAQKMLDELGLETIPVMGLAKDERHKTRAIINSDLEEITIDKKSNLFLLLEAMQNEVHRFAITFHRQVRSKTALESALDNIKGIGKQRKQILMKNFDNIEDIKKASHQKLAALGFPPQVISNLMCALNGSDQESNGSIQ